MPPGGDLGRQFLGGQRDREREGKEKFVWLTANKPGKLPPGSDSTLIVHDL